MDKHMQLTTAFPSCKKSLGVDGRIDALLRRNPVKPAVGDPLPWAVEPWDAPFHRLDRCTGYREAPQEARSILLHSLNKMLLIELGGIERTGMAYAARMSLSAESHEEQALYCRIGADEARHFQTLLPWLGTEDAQIRVPFTETLEAWSETGPRRALYVLIHVVLEGWGLVHYRSLRHACRDSRLQSALDSIIADETMHHSAGILLSGKLLWNQDERHWLFEALRDLLLDIRIGPVAWLQTWCRTLGIPDQEMRMQLMEALEVESQVEQRLSGIRRLLQPHDTCGVTEDLERTGLWRCPEKEEQLELWSRNAGI